MGDVCDGTSWRGVQYELFRVCHEAKTKQDVCECE